MYRQIERVTLKDGEEVAAGVVEGPDADWADRVALLLGHKGEVWRWGNEMVLRRELGLDVFYYILHRDGRPFTNMMTIEVDGVGLFGHVFTEPADRQKGAASALMPLAMEDFRRRGGRALFLGTGYDSHPFHLYAKNGFVGVEPLSGLMAYYTDTEEGFYSEFFGEGKTSIGELEWTDWPLSLPLFVGDYACGVRSHVMRLFGRSSTEGPLLGLLRDQSDEGSRTRVLRMDSGAVIGLSTTDRHPLWPGYNILDLYCHPRSWDQGGDLLASLDVALGERYLAYTDVTQLEKQAVLKTAGFVERANLPSRIPLDRARTQYADVVEWERRS